MAMRYTKNQAKIVGIIVTVGVAVGGGYFFLSPLVTSYSEAQEAISSAETDLASAQEMQTELQSYKDNFATIKSISDEVSTIFPTYANTYGMLQTITANAVESGISEQKLTLVSFGAPTIYAGSGGTSGSATTDDSTTKSAEADSGTTGEVSTTSSNSAASIEIKISASGTKEQLSDFLDRLNSITPGYIISTWSISSSSTGEEGADPEYTLSTDGYSYVYSKIEEPSDDATSTDSTDGSATTDGTSG